MLATDLQLTAWCPVHRAMLGGGAPRLCWDFQGHWYLVLASMSCPSAVTQQECIQKWIVELVPTEITPDQARALTKTETT